MNKMRRFLIILMICSGMAAAVFLLVSGFREDRSVQEETEVSVFHPSRQSARKKVVVRRKSRTEPEQLEDDELSDEELKATLDWLDGLSRGKEETQTQEAESQEEASPYKIETNAQEDWEGKVRVAYMERRKTFTAMREQSVPIVNESLYNVQRIDEILLYELKKPDKDAAALRECAINQPLIQICVSRCEKMPALAQTLYQELGGIPLRMLLIGWTATHIAQLELREIEEFQLC